MATGVNMDITDTTESNVQSDHLPNQTNITNNITNKNKRNHSGDSNETDVKKMKTEKNDPMYEMMKMLTANVQQLSTDIKHVSVRLEQRIDDLETNFEKKLTEKISTLVDTKINEKFNEIKSDVSSEVHKIEKRMSDIEQSIQSVDTNSKPNENDRKHNIVIRNIEFDIAEKTDNTITVNKVQALFKDGLKLSDIKTRTVTRKDTRGTKPGVIIVQLDSLEQKHEIMKCKNTLKEQNTYANVFIENDTPLETRIMQSSIRTMLKAVGKEKDFKFHGSRLIPKTQ